MEPVLVSFLSGAVCVLVLAVPVIWWALRRVDRVEGEKEDLVAFVASKTAVLDVDDNHLTGG